jgi:hypothetical protein
MPTDDKSSYDESPQGLAKRWQREMQAAHKDSDKWRKKAEKITKRYLGRSVTRDGESNARLNLFTSNINTIESIMYGKLPRVSVDRKWSDQNDDVARVAAVIMERLLNEDIEEAGDGYADALRYVLQDRLIPGLGTARVRYEMETETIEQPPIMGQGPLDPNTGMPTQIELAPAYSIDRKVAEYSPCDYVHWSDYRWSPCRTWRECRWVAYRAWMTKEDGLKRFGDIFERVPMKSASQQKKDSALDVQDPWERAEVWEIWCRDEKRVYWYVEGFDQTLDVKDDPLGLPGFFPGPQPFMASVTTSHLMPFPDYEQAQDLYSSIDILETRIDWLTKACKLVGVYDKSSVGIMRMFNEGSETELIPVDNWAMFAEKGGIKGQIDWLPIEQVANTIGILVQQRNDKINLLYQVTGLSDVLRGQSQGGATATEQAIKARYASTRIQSLQDQFAKFATELQSLKAHIIVTQYDDRTMLVRSNIMATPDAQYAQQAIQLLRSNLREYRIKVRPEDLAIQDYATLKAERSEALAALSNYIPRVIEANQAIPGSLPYMLELMKWGLMGFRGINTIEGVLDQAIDAAKQQAGEPQEPPAPDPTEQTKLQTAQVKGQAEQTKAQASVITSQTDLQKAQLGAREAQFEAALQRRSNAEMLAEQLIPQGPPR